MLLIIPIRMPDISIPIGPVLMVMGLLGLWWAYRLDRPKPIDRIDKAHRRILKTLDNSKVQEYLNGAGSILNIWPREVKAQRITNMDPNVLAKDWEKVAKDLEGVAKGYKGAKERPNR